MKLLSALGLALALFVVPLAGCADFRAVTNTIGAIADASVPAKTVIIAANSFGAVEATAKNIIVACTPVQRPAACNDTVLRKLIAAVRAGRNARDGLESFLAAHPGQLGSKGLYDALQASIATITQAISTYQANGG